MLVAHQTAQFACLVIMDGYRRELHNKKSGGIHTSRLWLGKRLQCLKSAREQQSQVLGNVLRFPCSACNTNRNLASLCRLEGERIVKNNDGAHLIRINLEQSSLMGVYSGRVARGVSLPCGGLRGLKLIESFLPK